MLTKHSQSPTSSADFTPSAILTPASLLHQPLSSPLNPYPKVTLVSVFKNQGLRWAHLTSFQNCEVDIILFAARENWGLKKWFLKICPRSHTSQGAQAGWTEAVWRHTPGS